MNVTIGVPWMNMQSNIQKKKYVDAVKGFCILLVVMVHAGGIPVPTVRGFFAVSYMQTFFFVAGITYKNRSEETFGKFAVKKAKRLLLPYFTYATILLLIDVLLNHRNMSEILNGGGGYSVCKTLPAALSWS